MYDRGWEFSFSKIFGKAFAVGILILRQWSDTINRNEQHSCLFILKITIVVTDLIYDSYKVDKRNIITAKKRYYKTAFESKGETHTSKHVVAHAIISFTNILNKLAVSAIIVSWVSRVKSLVCGTYCFWSYQYIGPQTDIVPCPAIGYLTPGLCEHSEARLVKVSKVCVCVCV